MGTRAQAASPGDPAKYVVRKERLELSRLAALEPKSSAYTNFATSAYMNTAAKI